MPYRPNNPIPARRLSGLLLVLVAGWASLPAQNADYKLNVDLKEDTYRSVHILNFSQEYFDKFMLVSHNELTSKISNVSKHILQQRATLNLNYAARKDLSLGCSIWGADDSDNRREVGSNNYTCNADYQGQDYLKLSQTVGGISENRHDIVDNGLQYNTKATITVPQRSRTSLLIDLGTSGNNLRWGKLGYNAAGHLDYQFTEENKLELDISQNQSANKDITVYRDEQYLYTVHTLRRNLGLKTDYNVGERYTVGVDATYNQNERETDDKSGTARAIDFSDGELKMAARLLQGDLGVCDLTGNYIYTTGSKQYEDKNRNENWRGFSTSGRLLFKESLVDSLSLNGSFEKNSLFDQDQVDDRDDLSVKTSVRFPIQLLSRLTLVAAANIYVNKTVYVHPQKSINSKWNMLYKVSPELHYRFGPRLQFHQTYLLSSQYIESIVKDMYENLDDIVKDNLYRSFTIENRITCRLSDQYNFSLAYDLEHGEDGVFEGGLFEDVFIQSVDQREQKHTIRVNFTYRFWENILIAPLYTVTKKLTWNIVHDSQGQQLGGPSFSSYSHHTAQLMVEYTVLDKLTMDFSLRHLLRVREDHKQERDNFMTLNLIVPLL